MSNEIPQAQVDKDNETVASILEHLPVQTEIDVMLPSKGIPYFGKQQLVSVRPILFEDEKYMATAGNNPDSNPVSYLLSRCVKGVDPEDLILIDKLFLILKIREISYGNDYSVGVGCKSCGYANTLNLEIDKLSCTDIPEDFDVFNIPIELKGIKKNAVVCAPTGGQETYLGANIDKNLWRFIKSIDGVDDITIIAEVVKQLPIRDIHTIVKAFSLEQFGIQSTVKYNCDSCASVNVITLPIDENFFSVN